MSRYSRINWLTCVVLVWFHVQAVAAFFSFTWTNLIVAAAVAGLSFPARSGIGDERSFIEVPGNLLAACAYQVLHVGLGLAPFARECEIDVDEVFRQLHQRTEIRQLAPAPRAY